MKYYILIYIPLLIGFIFSNLFKKDKWYDDLKKLYYPKPYVYGFIWSILYLVIGYTYYILLHDKSIKYWIIPLLHLTINYFYLPILYSFHDLTINLFLMILLVLSSFILLIQFYLYDKSTLAFKLFIPYVLWMLFALYLYVYIYINNIENGNKYKDNFLYYLFYKNK